MAKVTFNGVRPIKSLVRHFRLEFERRIAEHKNRELLELAE